MVLLLLQVLGEGELSKPLNIEAAKFSSSASEKISSAGATATVLPLRKKWTRKAHEKVRALRGCLPCVVDKDTGTRCRRQTQAVD